MSQGGERGWRREVGGLNVRIEVYPQRGKFEGGNRQQNVGQCPNTPLKSPKNVPLFVYGGQLLGGYRVPQITTAIPKRSPKGGYRVPPTTTAIPKGSPKGGHRPKNEAWPPPHGPEPVGGSLAPGLVGGGGAGAVERRPARRAVGRLQRRPRAFDP